MLNEEEQELHKKRSRVREMRTEQKRMKGTLEKLTDTVNELKEERDTRLPNSLREEYYDEEESMSSPKTHRRHIGVNEDEEEVETIERIPAYLTFRDLTHRPDSRKEVFYRVTDGAIEIEIKPNGEYKQISPIEFSQSYSHILEEYGGQKFYIKRLSTNSLMFTINCATFEDEWPCMNPNRIEKMKKCQRRGEYPDYDIKNEEWVLKPDEPPELALPLPIESLPEVINELPKEELSRADMREMIQVSQSDMQKMFQEGQTKLLEGLREDALKNENQQLRDKLAALENRPPTEKASDSTPALITAIAALKPDAPNMTPYTTMMTEVMKAIGKSNAPVSPATSEADSILREIALKSITSNPSKSFVEEATEFSNAAAAMGFSKAGDEMALGIAKEVRMGVEGLGKSVMGYMAGMDDDDEEEEEELEIEKSTGGDEVLKQVQKVEGIPKLRDIKGLPVDKELEFCKAYLVDLKDMLPFLKNREMLKTLNVKMLKMFGSKLSKGIRKLKPGTPKHKLATMLTSLPEDQVFQSLDALVDNYAYAVERLSPGQTSVIKHIQYAQKVLDSERGKKMIIYLRETFKKYLPVARKRVEKVEDDFDDDEEEEGEAPLW